MTLEEAIKHCLEVAERYDRVEDSHADDGLKLECIQCAADHRQLAEWLTELKEAKRLLKAAVEDMTGMQFGEECKVCSKKLLPNECPIHNNVSCILGKDFKWRYADEALALIGEEGDTNG